VKNDQSDLSFFCPKDGTRLAYRLRVGAMPTLLFLPGYASDMDGAKALAIDEFASRLGLGIVRFDYSGTGASDGSFEHGTLDHWLNETLAVIDELTQGPLILIGSSMGGWLALHATLRRTDRVHALVGIAAAPDFTDWGFTDDQKMALERDGRLGSAQPGEDGPRIVTRGFWRSGEALRLLDGPIAIDCPVRLVHGETDGNVPVEVAQRLMRQLRSGDVQLNILKGSGHRLSEPHEIEAILRTVQALVEPT
jgi:pimeloyl-ACP methyl ester carboxylesterase